MRDQLDSPPILSRPRRNKTVLLSHTAAQATRKHVQLTSDRHYLMFTRLETFEKDSSIILPQTFEIRVLSLNGIRACYSTSPTIFASAN